MSKELNELGFLSVGSQLRRIYEKLQSGGDKVYASAEITFKSSWFPIYYTIINSKRPLTVMEITDQISYSRITVKNVVKELVLEKFVKVVVNPDDGRSKLVSLTEKGRELVPELETLWDSFSIELKKIFNLGNSDFIEKLTEVNKSLNESSFEKRVLKDYFNYTIRNSKEEEFKDVGKLMVDVYSALEGFPNQEQQPEYYDMLNNVGNLTKNERIELLVAVSEQGKIGGAVVFFNDMKDYGSGGTATKEKNACGFRLLAVDSKTRGLGLGKSLTLECITKAKKSNSDQVIIHTTKAMKIAWGMYESLGFKRSEDLDFIQGSLPVFGFRLRLKKASR